jgi:hypothetical protein
MQEVQMPRVTLVYKTKGLLYRTYVVPQVIIDQGRVVVDKYIGDNEHDPIREEDDTELACVDMKLD